MKDITKMSLRILTYFVFCIIITLLFSPLLLSSSQAVRMTTNAILVIIEIILFYNLGNFKGERDAVVSRAISQRTTEGRNIHRDDASRGYFPAKGIIASLLAVSIPLIAAVILAFIATPPEFTLPHIPDWVSGVIPNYQFDAQFNYMLYTTPFTIESALRILVRLFIWPFMISFGSFSGETSVLVDRISWLLIFIFPAAYSIGYVLGPLRRKEMNTIIEKNRKLQESNEKDAPRK